MSRRAIRSFSWLLLILLYFGYGTWLTLNCWADAAPQPAKTGWAFVKPVGHEPPSLSDRGWCRNPIDQFVLQKLQSRGLQPAPEARKETLIRRAYLDLVGFPPTPQEVDEFVSDSSPDVYDKLIDRLLDSPHYGERWARHWLDLARYAESEGFKADETRPNAWRYRDYVIRSLNSDKPYDRFVQEQIAGDELWPSDPEARVATAFNRHYPDESNARELFQRRQDILNDITDTVGAVFTGLTFGCARCHDHKYDPISQEDYYRLQAFFADIRADDEIVMASPDAVREYDAKRAAWEEKTKDIREPMEKLEEPRRKAILKDYFDKYPEEIRQALLKAPAERTPMDWLLHYKAAQYMEPGYQYLANPAACVGSMKAPQKEEWNQFKQELEQYKDLKPADLPIGTGIRDAGRESPPTYLLKRGVFNAPVKEVTPGFPHAIESSTPTITPPKEIESTGRRTALAKWLTNPDNPLTARVMVNRIWHYHFGRGIVATPSDFGAQGDRPSHPELLDYLALTFQHDGWSMKKLHRLIMTSSTYRQASVVPNSAAAKADPEDRLLWRFPRVRLDAETIRDSALAVSGLLNERMFGPSVFPEVPAGMEVRGGWSATKDPAERNRRSVYVFVRRNTRYPMFDAFDMPDTHESCPRRFITTTPTQALTLLNNKLTLQWAQALAGRVLKEAGAQQSDWPAAGCRLAYSHTATADELDSMRRFLDQQSSVIAEDSAKHPVLPSYVPEGVQPAAAAALVDLCHVLINSNEFVYTE